MKYLRREKFVNKSTSKEAYRWAQAPKYVKYVWEFNYYTGQFEGKWVPGDSQ